MSFGREWARMGSRNWRAIYRRIRSCVTTLKPACEQSEDDAHVLNVSSWRPNSLVTPRPLLFVIPACPSHANKPRPVLAAHVFLQPGVCGRLSRPLSVKACCRNRGTRPAARPAGQNKGGQLPTRKQLLSWLTSRVHLLEACKCLGSDVCNRRSLLMALCGDQ